MKDLFTGTWSLVSYELKVEEGDPICPMGIAPIGIATFDPHGFVSVQLSSSERPCFSSDSPGPGEIQAAFSSYIAYFGKYTIDKKNKTLTTQVLSGTNPAWAGEDQLRYYDISEKYLVLRTKPQKVKALGDICVVGTVTWERVLPAI